MIHSVVPVEWIASPKPMAQPPAPALVNGVSVTQAQGVIRDVLSSNPGDYLRLPIAGRCK